MRWGQRGGEGRGGLLPFRILICCQIFLFLGHDFPPSFCIYSRPRLLTSSLLRYKTWEIEKKGCDRGKGWQGSDPLSSKGREDKGLPQHIGFDRAELVLSRDILHHFIATTQQLVACVAKGALPNAVAAESQLPQIRSGLVLIQHVKIVLENCEVLLGRGCQGQRCLKRWNPVLDLHAAGHPCPGVRQRVFPDAGKDSKFSVTRRAV